MAGLDPFQPDQDYCVYCHAPAAGMCARCGALCCGDCVELVMGWTTQRAICSSCADAEPATPRQAAPWLLALIVAAGVGLVLALAY